MNIIVTINRDYIPPLTVMMTSLLENSKDDFVSFYIIHSALSQEDFNYIKSCVPFDNYSITGIAVPQNFMESAPVIFHFTKEMYYRLFAAQLLPEEVDRALYLDPDMVVINSLNELYRMELGDCLFAAARAPNPLTQRRFKKRLGIDGQAEYFNSGVLLMNIKSLRERHDEPQIMEFIEKYGNRLMLPDQDVLNVFYSKKTVILDPNIYNFDARYYKVARLLPPVNQENNWIEHNTVIIHYCGKNKPWKENYKGYLGRYYKKYSRLLSSCDDNTFLAEKEPVLQ